LIKRTDIKIVLVFRCEFTKLHGNMDP